MKCHNKGLVIVLLTMLVAGLPGRAVEGTSTMPDWIKDHLEIGTRVTYFWLHDDYRNWGTDNLNHFTGSINNLEIQQQYLPVKLFVAYKINPYWGVELAAEQLEVETWSRPEATALEPVPGSPWTDGTINLVGPIASVFGRYPNATRFTPYAGVGAGYFFADFSEDAQWHHPRDGRFQALDLDDTYGGVVYVGVMARINENWSADLLIRYIKMSVDGTFMVSDNGYSYREDGDVTFPMSSTSVGLGVRYSF